ncbi:MAG: hypothetical protein QOG04_594 [Actinomycetota bacterium]|nr:hypothetical protein [Actinomycetota bacterium]
MAAISASIERVANESNFSGVVRIALSGSLLFEGVWGLADRAHKIPNSIETQFGIASAVKGFTALAVMSLVTDGALTLGSSVRDILGDELKDIDPAVTVGHLLSHTSGIGDYLDEGTVSDVSDYVMPVPVHELATTKDYLAALRGHPMKFTPGERFEYCNGGYVVLALVIEAVTGSTFHEVVAERVFVPAGMSSTAFLRMDELPGAAALGYLATDGLRTNQLHLPVRGSGDGGAYSTIDDLSRFWAALFTDKILPAAVVTEMTRPRHDVPTESKRYGLGFWLRQDRPTVMLEGYDAGVSFRSAYDPGSEFLYTVISNTSDGAWPLVKQLDERLPDLVA